MAAEMHSSFAALRRELLLEHTKSLPELSEPDSNAALLAAVGTAGELAECSTHQLGIVDRHRAGVSELGEGQLPVPVDVHRLKQRLDLVRRFAARQRNGVSHADLAGQLREPRREVGEPHPPTVVQPEHL